MPFLTAAGMRELRVFARPMFGRGGAATFYKRSCLERSVSTNGNSMNEW